MGHVSVSFPSHLIPILEASLLLLGLALLALCPAVLPPYRRFDTSRLSRWSRRRPLRAAVTLGLLSGLLTALLCLGQGPPVPTHSDEFSFLFGAETFLAGRFANPPMPHEALVGNYLLEDPLASKYPPGQSLLLALGAGLFGHPMVSLWLSSAMLTFTMTWCLAGYLPGNWAFVGGIAVALRLGAGSYWNQSYMGGSLAAIAGALLFGALPRLAERPRLVHGLCLGVALATLQMTRPFEGLLVSIVPTLWIARRCLSQGRRSALLLATPALSLLLCGVAFHLYNNKAITGDPWLLPHAVYERTHPVAGEFVWQRYSAELGETVFRDRPPELSDNSGWWRQSLRYLLVRPFRILSFFLGAGLALPLFLSRSVCAGAYRRLACASCALVLVGHSLVGWYAPHYSAPLAAPLYLLAVTALRSLIGWRRRGRRVGPKLVVALMTLQAFLFVAQIPAYRPTATDFTTARVDAQKELEVEPGRHLVLVSDTLAWMVYNPPRYENAKVLWARDLGSKSLAALHLLFPDRQVWRLDFSGATPQLVRVRADG